MPKIIENLESRLIEEAGRQIAEGGYSVMTIRSVAKGCGVGVGTVYNYFPSKDALLASWLLRDWQGCIVEIQQTSTASAAPEPVVRCVFDQLRQFDLRHQNIFRDASAAEVFAGAFRRYHSLLRQQLAKPLEKFCGEGFPAEFAAEALLTWTMAGREFDEIYGMMEKLF